MIARSFVFGKLPSHGDFVARGLTAVEAGEWDRHLTGSMQAARAAMGDAFEASYPHAPPWRFRFTVDGNWCAGAVALSLDRVGRKFPIVAGRTARARNAVACIPERSEALLFQAIPGGWTRDQLFEALESLAVAQLSSRDEPCGWWVDGGEGLDIAPLSDPRPGELIAAMLALHEDVL
jgi:type VI secretion system protein ImpM